MAKILLRDKIYLTGLEYMEAESIKDGLTLPNPQYANALRYSGYSRVSLPRFLTYYTSMGSSGLAVPIGFDVSQHAEVEDVKDERISSEVDYPEFLLELRDDQKEAAENYIELNQPFQIPQGIITLPTGKGKTVIGLYIASALRQKTLIIVHKDDLVLGWINDIALCFGKSFKPGLIKAKDKVVGEQITVATIQTLSRMDEGRLESLFEEFGLVICDEGHHISANTYTMFGRFSSLYKMLLTATPERADGLSQVMFYYAGDFAYKYEGNKEEKDILPVKVIIQESKVKYSPCIDRNGNLVNYYDIPEGLGMGGMVLIEDLQYEMRPKVDYHKVDDYVVTNSEFREKVIGDIEREARKGRSCIVFLNQKEHCRIYYERLSELFKDSVQLFYGDNKEANELVLERAESKACLVTVATYSKATEGTNCKAWEVCFLASSLNSGKNVEQAIGRVRRTKEGKISPVRVYDYRNSDVYMMRSHGTTRDARYLKLGFKCEGDFSPYFRSAF
ncbi:MAG: DEAD/DEAH box helicase family protein [Clostridiales bacterium]|nr:DEAD/DEAH box helicase family protein [Clostridiales bacterium]